MSNVIFTDVSSCVRKEYYPCPAEKDIPDWYNKTLSYIGDKKTLGMSTIKKCMPVFDAMTMGYFLKIPMDVEVILVEDKQFITTQQNQIEFFEVSTHPVEQAPLHPMKRNQSYFKINNPWSITTDEGYSCLLINPMHRESPISIMEGVVDTDKYVHPINLPFVLKDGFEGIIKAGTPYAQVIPFKREDFTMSLKNVGTEEFRIRKVSNQLEKADSEGLLNTYKNLWRSRKSYK